MAALYNQDTISQEIHTKWAGKTVHFVKETDSTNTLAKKLAREGAPHGTLSVAEFQTAGRGRFERRWTAPEGSSAMMTLLLRPKFEPRYASMLTLVMGLSVAQAAGKLPAEAGGSSFNVQIKWPNDVVVSRKKICGILTEMGVQGTEISYVVIGAGINVNTKEFPGELENKATSLYLEGGQELDRSHVIGLVMECFEKNYDRFVHTCDFTELKEEYEQLLANMGKPVRVLDTLKPYEGICLGIDREGELLVRREDGSVSRVRAGEVSVRGLYSYI